ncbi:MAG: SH3 domain-containing protein [Chloroflexota bacterium]
MRPNPLIALIIAALTLIFAAPAMAQTAVGTVTAQQLNVRTLPDPVDGVAVAVVLNGQSFVVIGRDANANWFEISLPGGGTGWVSSAYFQVGNFATVPVTSTAFVQGRVLSPTLNIRTAPTTAANSLGLISRGQVYRVLGKNADASWFQVRLPTGITGWVFGRSLFVTDEAALPVISTLTTSLTTTGVATTGTTATNVIVVPSTTTTTTGTTTFVPATTTTSSVATSGTVTTTTASTTPSIAGAINTGIVVNATFVNIRTLPDPLDGIAFATASEGDILFVVGRDATTSWFQVALDGTNGWMSSAYLSVANAIAVPVTFDEYVQGTVTGVSLLNVRNSPTAATSTNIIGQISNGQTYRVFARTSGGWYQIRLTSGVTGWVNGRFLNVSNPSAVPLTQ